MSRLRFAQLPTKRMRKARPAAVRTAGTPCRRFSAICRSFPVDVRLGNDVSPDGFRFGLVHVFSEAIHAEINQEPTARDRLEGIARGATHDAQICVAAAPRRIAVAGRTELVAEPASLVKFLLRSDCGGLFGIGWSRSGGTRNSASPPCALHGQSAAEFRQHKQRADLPLKNQSVARRAQTRLRYIRNPLIGAKHRGEGSSRTIRSAG